MAFPPWGEEGCPWSRIPFLRRTCLVLGELRACSWTGVSTVHVQKYNNQELGFLYGVGGGIIVMLKLIK